MSISPEDTTVGSRLNIHVSVIMLIGVSINKRFVPWSVEEYMVLMNKDSTSRRICIGSKNGLVYNTVMVVLIKVTQNRSSTKEDHPAVHTMQGHHPVHDPYA
jgi:hypothetical protein